MKKKITLSLSFIFLTFFSYSQIINLPQVIPPSPNAASLAQYADVPVSNYTGVPNISVPLFNIKSGKIELPITVSYHASGIKVSQEASSVGLGWALNAGGAITRQVRGFDDFTVGGYISNTVPPSTSDNLPYNPPSNPLLYWGQYYTWLNSSNSTLKIDGEPDIFYFNFMGFSGQFFFQQQNYVNGSITAVSVDQNNLKISFNGIEWTITDGNGWKYNFGKSSLYATEKTTSYDYTIDGHFSTNPSIFETRNIMPFDTATEYTETAWYLTKVTTPEGDKIDFTYSNNDQYKTLSNLSYSERITQKVNELQLDDLGNLVLNPNNLLAKRFYSSFSQEVVESVYLKKITFKNGYIDFTTDDRDDIRKYPNSSLTLKSQKIKSAELFDLNNNSIKKVDFNYSYFNDYIIQTDPTHKENLLRLKLDSVKESFKDKSTGIYSSLPPYIFTYNSTPLPDKLSFSIDFWGYYNGKNNDNIAPYDYAYLKSNSYGIEVSNNDIGQSFPTIKMLSPRYIGLNYGNLSYLEGANREVDPIMSKACILEKITYPTGGSMSFEYSPNMYYSTDTNSDEKESIDFYVVDYSDYEVQPQQKEAIFTITTPVLFYIDFKVYKNDYNYSSHPTPFYGEAALKDMNGNNIIYLQPNLEFDEWGNFSARRSITLNPGTYRLNAENGTDTMSDVIISANYFKKIINNKKYGAGIKIDAITTIDNGNTVKRKKYSYEANGLSTGVMLSPVNYWYNRYLLNATGSDIGINEGLSLWDSQSVLTRSSNNLHPFGASAQGQIIGYDQVSISDVDLNNNNLGSSQYFYENIKELPAQYFIPGVPNRINLSNGQLLKEIHANKDGKTINEKNYFYETSGLTKTMVKGVMRFETFNTITDEAISSIRFYDVNSEWRYLKNTTETLYDLNGLNPITTSTTFKYDNPSHKNLTETQTINSKGQQIITTNKYPSDQPSGTGMTTNDYNFMVSQNILNPILKQETKLNSNLLSTQVTTYKNWNLDVNQDNIPDNIFLPEYVKTAKGTNLLDNRVQYHSYYPNGNIQEVSKTDGTHIVYIWGYNNEYPIAMIENATYSEVAAYVADLQLKSNLDTDNCLDTQTCNEKNLRTSLNNLRNDVTYKNKWQVTSYTYNPLIGVTSITDPKGYIIYYNYDSFGRLANVKDKAGNILSENQYNYKQ